MIEVIMGLHNYQLKDSKLFNFFMNTKSKDIIERSGDDILLEFYKNFNYYFIYL